MKLEFLLDPNSHGKSLIFLNTYVSDEIRKNLQHRLTDQFQTFMGNSGHHNVYFHENSTLSIVSLYRRTGYGFLKM